MGIMVFLLKKLRRNKRKEAKRKVMLLVFWNLDWLYIGLYFLYIKLLLYILFFLYFTTI